ncbi:hypothetical protein Bpfe_007304 [Biomphalaria pfeifferi]|uniref:Uncharacterized protein n=1 Tax=Biomphalaria pfeifferi TaxID=112525 RepID=A0AAD8FGK0_BIOPF|nr:hypothetical protein Bpfe_007304 [Biomphalaria pfeifferi]
MRGLMRTIQHPRVNMQDLMKEKTEESMGTMLSKTDEWMNKKDEPIYSLLNNTDELMSIMSRRITDPLLNRDADNGSAVRDFDNELYKRGSHDKKPDDCCEYHNEEHRPDYFHLIPVAYIQAFYDICADGCLQEECKYQKTCQQGYPLRFVGCLP